MKRRHDEVTGLGGLERDLCGLGVAKLADEDDVRILTQRTAQRLAERRRVQADLALVDDAALLLVDDLDRILDRQHVVPPRAVDVIDHRREGRRLTRARCAGNKNEAAQLVRETLDARRHAELPERRDDRRDDAEREAHLLALAEDVDAETRKTRRLIGKVEVALFPEEVDLIRPRDLHENVLQIERTEPIGLLEVAERAVAAQHRRAPGLQVNVARAKLDSVPEKFVQIHKGGIGLRRAFL